MANKQRKSSGSVRQQTLAILHVKSAFGACLNVCIPEVAILYDPEVDILRRGLPLAGCRGIVQWITCTQQQEHAVLPLTIELNCGLLSDTLMLVNFHFHLHL